MHASVAPVGMYAWSAVNRVGQWGRAWCWDCKECGGASARGREIMRHECKECGGCRWSVTVISCWTRQWGRGGGGSEAESDGRCVSVVGWGAVRVCMRCGYGVWLVMEWYA